MTSPVSDLGHHPRKCRFAIYALEIGIIYSLLQRINHNVNRVEWTRWAPQHVVGAEEEERICEKMLHSFLCCHCEACYHSLHAGRMWGRHYPSPATLAISHSPPQSPERIVNNDVSMGVAQSLPSIMRYWDARAGWQSKIGS